MRTCARLRAQFVAVPPLANVRSRSTQPLRYVRSNAPKYAYECVQLRLLRWDNPLARLSGRLTLDDVVKPRF